MVKVFIAALILLLASGAQCFGEGLDSLIEVGKSQADIQQEYKSETNAYKSVEAAVRSGAIKKWQQKAEIGKIYGEPVVKVDDPSKGRQKWVYKPASSDFLAGGPKINLFFDAQGRLDEIETAEK